MSTKTECACSRCQSACEYTPGWFRPGEAEKAAKFLGLSLPEFFQRYLGVNWWEATEPTFVLAPATHRMTPGSEYPGNPKGRCVFFTSDRKCQIHPVKPYECAHGNPCSQTDRKRLDSERRATVALWAKKQGQIRKLLGRTPATQPFSFLEAMFG